MTHPSTTHPVATSPQAVLRCPRDMDVQCLVQWRSDNAWLALDPDAIWIRFNLDNSRLVEQSKALPAERFRLTGRWLMREGHQVADAELPDLNWLPVGLAIELQLPWIGRAGKSANLSSCTWSLDRGGQECPVAGAIVTWDDLARWVDTAPQWRLARLVYSIAARPQEGPPTHPYALVLGTPVPPVPAQYLIARQRILLPAGMHWLPALAPDFVSRSFDLQAGQWLLWLTTDQWHIIDDSNLVPLTRASVRSLGSE